MRQGFTTTDAHMQKAGAHVQKTDAHINTIGDDRLGGIDVRLQKVDAILDDLRSLLLNSEDYAWTKRID